MSTTHMLTADANTDDSGLSDYAEELHLDDVDFESRGLTTRSHVRRSYTSGLPLLRKLVPLRLRRLLPRGYRRWSPKTLSRPFPKSYTFFGRRLRLLFKGVSACLLILIIFTAAFKPSYNDPPAHYEALRKRIERTDDFGRANIDNQKIFIAASIYDKGGHLAKGEWGRRVIQLLNLLGNRNVFLSIYENDGGQDAKDALQKFEEKVECQKELVYEEHLPLESIPNVTLQDGSKRIKRIAYLAEVRNQALRPLDDSDVVYDKILFLNDIVFNPIDAVQLLFSTNVDETGKASYDAACAVDFLNPFKFYDTFATRDIEGYSMGVPFFPWYSDAGKGLSRQDVLAGKDAVRVTSCWSGMVAFDAKYFLDTRLSRDVEDPTDHIQGVSETLRFRALPDRDWDASECCLIHADLLGFSSKFKPLKDTGIYQNPYVRVAYGSWTLWWLPITRRCERLYSLPHNLVNHLVGLPWYNERREQAFSQGEGNITLETSDAQRTNRIGDGYCGMKTLQLLLESPRRGEKNWEKVHIPS